MIISCEKCIKKFEISDNLIPEEGRLLHCGSCSHQWHYIPPSSIKLVNEVSDEKPPKKTRTKQKPKFNQTDSFAKTKEYDTQNSKKVGLLSYVLIIIISLIALVILADTLKFFLTPFIPNIDFYLSSLYESLKDI